MFGRKKKDQKNNSVPQQRRGPYVRQDVPAYHKNYNLTGYEVEYIFRMGEMNGRYIEDKTLRNRSNINPESRSGYVFDFASSHDELFSELAKYRNNNNLTPAGKKCFWDKDKQDFVYCRPDSSEVPKNQFKNPSLMYEIDYYGRGETPHSRQFKYK